MKECRVFCSGVLVCAEGERKMTKQKKGRKSKNLIHLNENHELVVTIFPSLNTTLDMD